MMQWMYTYVVCPIPLCRTIGLAAGASLLTHIAAADTPFSPSQHSAVPQTITSDDIIPLPGVGRQLVNLEPAKTSEAPVLAATPNTPPHRLLRRLYAEGTAAGNHGDFYENRDRGHSGLAIEAHPQLTHITHGPELRRADADYGLALNFLFNAPVIGNSSTALTAGPLARSLPRLALTGFGRDGPERLFQNYLTGQIHVYPEHRDHDPERGDLFPANTPYYLISQGSSGSDRPHLEALAMILAAFRPDTKTRLISLGLLAPTIQMVFRRAQNSILTSEAYHSGFAHPTVFPADRINLSRMVSLANAITPEDIPPLVRLKVEQDMQAREGIDYFGAGRDERLFDTPAAIARIWRSSAASRSIVISAEDTQDPNGRPLTFRWALLRGDPDHVRITPLPPDDRRAQIEIGWQDPQRIPGQIGLTSDRIDIGVFANNGVHDSAPSFLSILLPHHETRRYETAGNGQQRIAEIDHRPAQDRYVDPLIFPAILWKDTYEYSQTGEPVGWIRHREAAQARYDAKGARLQSGHGPDAPQEPLSVGYEIVQSDDSWKVQEYLKPTHPSHD